MFTHVRTYNIHMGTVQDLNQLQEKHATRPDIFAEMEEEQEIEILTQEITQVGGIYHDT